MLRTGVIWKSGWWWWVTSWSGWLLELLTELIKWEVFLIHHHLFMWKNYYGSGDDIVNIWYTCAFGRCCHYHAQSHIYFFWYFIFDLYSKCPKRMTSPRSIFCLICWVVTEPRLYRSDAIATIAAALLSWWSKSISHLWIDQQGRLDLGWLAFLNW